MEANEVSPGVEDQKRRGPNGVLTGLRVALKSGYDNNISPVEYEQFVDRVFKRTEFAESLAKLLATHIPVNRDGNQSKVLDVAAGTGIVSRALEEKGYAVVATDISHDALTHLEQRSPQIQTQQANMNDGLPFDNNTFDAVTSVWGNRYIKDTDLFLRETLRVLTPGGTLVWPIFPLERNLWRMRNGVHQHTTPANLMKDALKAGFDKVEIISPKKEAGENVPFFARPQYIVAKKREAGVSEEAMEDTVQQRIEIERESHESRFGGNIEVVNAKAEVPKTDIPVYFAGGIGKTSDDDKPYLRAFAEKGRNAFTLGYHGKRKLDMSLAARKTEEGKAWFFREEENKAESLIEAMDAKKLKRIDVVVQSEDVLHVLLAAHRYPEKFRSIVFAYPAGLMGFDTAVGVATRVAAQSVLKRVLNLSELMSKEDPPARLRRKGSSRSRVRHPARTLVEGASVAYSRFDKLLHDLRHAQNAPTIAIVAGLNDVIFPASGLLKQLEPGDYDLFEVTNTRHGMGYRREAFEQIEECLTVLNNLAEAA